MTWDGTKQAESARYVPSTAVPAALREWADALIGTSHGKKVVAGWNWDGRSPGVVLLLAPKGRRYEDAPNATWRRALKEIGATA